jgi:hypothetical protein
MRHWAGSITRRRVVVPYSKEYFSMKRIMSMNNNEMNSTKCTSTYAAGCHSAHASNDLMFSWWLWSFLIDVFVLFFIWYSFFQKIWCGGQDPGFFYANYANVCMLTFTEWYAGMHINMKFSPWRFFFVSLLVCNIFGIFSLTQHLFLDKQRWLSGKHLLEFPQLFAKYGCNCE